MKPLVLLIGISLSSCKSDPIKQQKTEVTEDLEARLMKHKPWHAVEGLENDPFSLPSCDLNRVTSIKVGDKLEDIEKIAGHRAHPFYHQNAFSILHASDTESNDYYWEVALRHDEGNLVTDISYRKVKTEVTEDPFD